MARRQHRPLCILACGRSGTLYTSQTFRAAGMDLGHEAVGAFGTVSMYFPFPDPDLSLINHHQAKPLHVGECRNDFRFDHIWHQVRHPLRAIDSMAGAFTRKVRLWTSEALEFDLPGESGELRCSIEDKRLWAMHYWFLNNQLCECQAAFTYRVENMGFEWPVLMRKLGQREPALFPNVDTTTNRSLRYAFKSNRRKQIDRDMYQLTWSDLYDLDRPLARRIRDMARGYGYRGDRT